MIDIKRAIKGLNELSTMYGHQWIRDDCELAIRSLQAWEEVLNELEGARVFADKCYDTEEASAYRRAIGIINQKLEQIEELEGEEIEVEIKEADLPIAMAEKSIIKKGMTVFVLVEYDSAIKKYTRVKPDVVEDIYTEEKTTYLSFRYFWHDLEIEEVGKTIFLTKEEAENHLNDQIEFKEEEYE